MSNISLLQLAPQSVDVDVARSVDDDVRRPRPAMGVRKSRSVVSVGVRERLASPARPCASPACPRQPVDVVHQPGLQSGGVDVVRPMSVGVPRQPGTVDVVHPLGPQPVVGCFGYS